jgi:hypothetical protein
VTAVATGATPPTAPAWWPGGLSSAVRTAEALRHQWQYVVVEEVVGATVELLRWPWPLADALGRLFWEEDADERAMTAAVPLRLLRLQLYRPNDLVRRPRAGDTFAAKIGARAGGWGDETAVGDLRTLFPGPVYDVSADAREAAKLAYQGASSAVFDGSRDPGMLEEAQRSRERRPRAKRLKVLALEDVIDDEGDLP